MIKIKNDFDRTDFINVSLDTPTPLYEYYYYMLNKFKNKYNGHLINQNITIVNDDFEIKFLPRVMNPKSGNPYTISFKTLLTGTRDEVLAVDGIKFYMDICRLKSCVKSKCKEADFLKQLYKVFPDEIVGPTSDNPNKYILNAKEVNVQDGNNPSVDNFEIIADFIETKIKSYDTGYYSYYSSIARINYMNTIKAKKRKSSIPAYLTFEEVKDYLTLMYKDVTALLDAMITYSSNGKKKTKKVPSINYKDIDDYLRHKLMDSIGIKTCPYCNRQYITSYVKEDNNNTTADLDHYYQKSLFPLFALSSFNFIPSCHVCNSLMKGDKYAETLYPYEDSAEEYVRFEITPTNGGKKKDIVDIWLGKGKESFPEIKKISELNVINLIKGRDDAKKTTDDKYREKLIDNEIELFHLKEIYKNHLDQAVNVLLIMRIYLEEYFYTRNINSICKNIGITSVKNGTSITKEEIRSFLLGMITDGQGEMDKPLAKMISDIYNNEVKNVSSNSIIEVNSIEEKILKLNIQDAIDLLRNSPLSEKDIIDLIAKKFEVAVEVVKKYCDEPKGK